jgi:alkanesulfonate monooxygenase SsuD/methylene tetrahydromethanopterin reductase-like flavin-dependent oxidoreductase (luciferase family)
MDIGLALFPTDYTIDPARVARLAEERGFHSLLFPEHTHIPVNRDTPYPDGGELPPEYSHTYDVFVTIAMAAAVTERLKVGPGVCLVIQRDPIITAKEVASIDALSGGRFLFGVGAGWNREEMANHGTDPSRRFKRSGPRTRRSTTVSSSTSTRSGAGRSRSSSRTRRCSWAAPARRCSTECWPTATSGCRTA